MYAVMPDRQRIEDLVHRARHGDQEAIAEVAAEFHDTLVDFAESRIGPSLRREIGPEDVAQDALLKALGSLTRFEWRSESSFRQWLFGIAEHLIRNASRRRSASIRELSMDVTGDEESPSHALRKGERFDRLEKAITALSPDHRKVIRLARIEGLKIAEIAKRMNRSEGAIHQLLSRAMSQLKHRFGETRSLSLPDRALDIGGEPDA